jgi:hypothetical protein
VGMVVNSEFVRPRLLLKPTPAPLMGKALNIDYLIGIGTLDERLLIL